MKKTDSPLPSYDHNISALFYLLFLILFAVLGLVILFYPEPFDFWQHAFSDLGDDVSKHGFDNLLSRKIYTTGMIAESLILFRISVHYKPPASFRNQTIKRWLAVLGGFGFLISTPPNHRYHVIHSIGIGMVVASLYFITMFFLIELHPKITAWRFYLDTAIVQIVVFPYAIGFFIDSAHKQSLQKFCIIGLFFMLLQSASFADDSFTIRDFLQGDRKVQH